MNARNLIYRDRRPHRALSLILFCAWFVLIFMLAHNHVVWRDEARTYSLVTQQHSLPGLIRRNHGESNPMLWTLLVYVGHALFPHPVVLQIAAFIVAAVSMLLLVFRSPFSSLVFLFLLSSRFAVYEFSVMARNYGISMLLLFLLAAAYGRYRDRGIVLGVLLFLLANTNVHSVILVGAFLVFWLLDLVRSNPANLPAAIRKYGANAALAFFGIAVCVISVYPPINETARMSLPHGSRLIAYVVRAIIDPARHFDDLVLLNFFTGIARNHPWLRDHTVYHAMSLLLFGSTLGLVRRPAALIASWLALIGFSVCFAVLYPGFYRHEVLWLIFLISMYWIAGHDKNENAAGSPARGSAVRIIQICGYAAFLLVLALQTVGGVEAVAVLRKGPESRARDFGQLVAAHPELHDATVIADPDYLVETLPYYVSNPTYLLREHRFGNIVHFTRKATLDLSLDDVLNAAIQLRATTGKPVIILLQDRLNSSAPPEDIFEAYDWEFTTTPEQVRRFQSSTHMLASYGRVSDNDETYDVYVLN